MATDEAARHELYEQLSAAIGPRPTETLMSYLPPTGWSDVATRRDVDHLGAVLRGELDQVAAGLRGEMSQLREELRGEMRELREGLRGEMGGLREEFRGAMGALRVDVADRLRQQTLAMVGAMVTLSGVVGAAAALL